MRRPAAIALMILVAAFAAPAPGALAADAPGFIAGTEDIPLMPGLKNDPATLVVFDKPQGRIVEVEAKGKVTRTGVEKFYAATLPGLGWSADVAHAWKREGEGLRLTLKGRDGDLRVAFSLAPR